MSRALFPWRETQLAVPSDLRSEFDQIMRNFFGEAANGTDGADYSPRLNISETEQGYEVSLDLPGVDPANVKVEAHDGKLTVSGERHHEEKVEGKTFHRVERSYGTFRRVINLPSTVDNEKIDANYKNGVLSVKLPKSEAVKPKQIEVKSE